MWEGGAGKWDASKQAWNISYPWSIHCVWQADHFDLKNVYRHPAWKESTYKNVKQQQQQQNMSIIKNDYIFRLFAAISLYFFSVIFFHFRTDEKKLIKTEYYLKLVQLFFGHNFLFTKGDTLKVTLSKLSKLPVSNYFLIYVEVQFYSWF